MHATWRPCEASSGSSQAVMQAISQLPGAKERLRWFIADLMEEGSYGEAMAGCR